MAMILIGLVGGLAIFLFGMQVSSEGLQKTAGATLKTIISKLTRNRLVAVLIGMIVTVLLQSSSATTVILVGLVRASLMELKQAIGIILGADVGTTLTVQLLAFKITHYSLLVVAIGFFLIFLAKKRSHKFIGQVFLGFGFVFLGMQVMSDAVAPLRNLPGLPEKMAQLSTSPLLGILISAIFTGIIQASAATIGIALSLANEGLLPLQGAIPIILGANIGTCMTAGLAIIGAPTEAKRVALIHVLFKIFGVVLLVPFIEPFGKLVMATSGSVPRQIANAHTLFNVGITILFLPFALQLARLVEWLLPVKADKKINASVAQLDRNALNTPTLALEQAFSEIRRVGTIVLDMTAKIPKIVMGGQNEDIIKYVEEKEAVVDTLFVQVSLYLTDISERALSEQESTRHVSLLWVLNDLEHIGDIILHIIHFARKKASAGLSFSPEGMQEITSMHSEVQKVLSKSLNAWENGDTEMASSAMRESAAIGELETNFRLSHVRRLCAGLGDSRATTSIHLDVINSLLRISEHARVISRVVVEPVGSLQVRAAVAASSS